MEGHQQDHAQDKGQHDQPGVLVDQALDRRIEETHARDQGRHQELDRQEAVDLSKESHPEEINIKLLLFAKSYLRNSSLNPE